MKEQGLKASISLFGIPLYQKIADGLLERREYLAGMYREVLRFDPCFGKSRRQAYLFGFPVWGKRFGRLSTSWFLGRSFVIREKKIDAQLASYLEETFKDVEVQPVKGKKHVVVLAGNAGEISFLIRYYFQKLLLDLNCRTPDQIVVLCTKRYHRDMLKMYFPSIRSKIGNLRILERLPGEFEASRWHVTMCFPRDYYIGKVSARHFVGQMSDWFGAADPQPRTPDEAFLETAYRHARSKLSAAQIEALDGRAGKGLVILAWEANTLAPLPESFQTKVRDDLIGRGFVLYENRTDPEKDKMLSYPEIYALTRRCAAVYALRSGLMDFLSDIQIPMYVYYTKIPVGGRGVAGKSPEEALKFFSLTQFNPYLKEIYLGE